MKKLVVLLFLFFTCSVGFSFLDSLKSKSVRVNIELGYATALSIPNSIFDQHGTVVGMSRAKFGLGMFYDFNENWTSKILVHYQRTFIKQIMFFSVFSDIDYIKLSHGLNEVSGTFSIHRKIIKDKKSSFSIGAGLQPWYYLTSTEKSKDHNVSYGMETFSSRIIARPFQKLKMGGYIGVMYEYRMKKSSWGMNLDLHVKQNALIDYSYEVDNWFIYEGSYSVTTPYLEIGTFISF